MFYGLCCMRSLLGFATDRERAARLAPCKLLVVPVGTAVTVLCLLFGSFGENARACTSFRLGGNPSSTSHVVAKSYDWDNGAGRVVTNKRGVRKSAMQLLSNTSGALTWTSRYASVTFNQYGREMPNGGMNERGLVVEILWLTDTQYAHPDKRSELNELQWIQYQLDNFSSVTEMVSHAPFIRVAPLYAKVHYFACDANADCATFEWLRGKLVIHLGASLPKAALANETYAASMRFAGPHLSGDANGRTLPSGSGSNARFTRAAFASGAKTSAPPKSVANAFQHLDSVAQGDFTKWQIVYEPKSLRMHFRARPTWVTKVVDVGALVEGASGACDTPALQLNLGASQGGDVTKAFKPWSAKDNRKLVQESFRALGAGALLLKPVVAQIASYPQRTRCVQK